MQDKSMEVLAGNQPTTARTAWLDWQACHARPPENATGVTRINPAELPSCQHRLCKELILCASAKAYTCASPLKALVLQRFNREPIIASDKASVLLGPNS